jgi:hypothetical protein
MLRALIVSGLLLMTVGFGAAGWQYWSNRPASAAGPEASAQPSLVAPGQAGWLVSPTGGLIPREDVRSYLAQERFVSGRIATVVHTAPLTALLAEGDSLPAEPYLQVFADIRAPRLAEGLCPVLLSGIAEDCALHSARVVPGSVDPVRGTARFQIDLAYRLKPEEEALPDLGDRVFETETLGIGQPIEPSADGAAEAAIEEGAGAAAPLDATVTEALATVIASGLAACGTDDDRQACRIMGLSVDWAPGSATTGQARIGWLSPLPAGLFQAPSLDPVPEAPQG